jgi:mannose-6-phosphate isomerase-like protein (cupin superfamily)
MAQPRVLENKAGKGTEWSRGKDYSELLFCFKNMNEIRAESVRDCGNRRIIRAFGQEGHVLVSSKETGDAFCILRIIASPTSITPPHLHRETDEIFVIESGEMEMNRGGELIRGQRGDVIYLPRGVPHAPRALGTEDLTVLVVCVPGGFDRFFAACGEEFKKENPDLQVLDNLAREYGIEFIVPPLS